MIFAWLFLSTFAALLLWSLAYFLRPPFIRWLVLRQVARGNLDKAEEILLYARNEAWIKASDEGELHVKINLKHLETLPPILREDDGGCDGSDDVA